MPNTARIHHSLIIALQNYVRNAGRENIMAKTHVDPVCNMEVDEQSAAGQSQYQGENYYFCSQDCKEKFDRKPEQYATHRGQSAGGTT